MYLLLHLKEELLQILSGGGGVFNSVNRNLIQIFDIISTSEDIAGFSRLPTHFTLTLIIFGSRYDIKNRNKGSVFTPLNTAQTKFEVIPP